VRIGRVLGLTPGLAGDGDADGDGARENGQRPGRLWLTVAALLAVIVGVGVGALVVGIGKSSGQDAGQQEAAAQPTVPPVPVSATELAKLPRATTFTSIAAAPLDRDPFALTGGLVMHPLAAQVLYAGPGERPIAVLPATELGGPTWVPVVQATPGWDRVLLPSRPNRATGWIFTGGSAGSRLEVRSSAYLIRIQTGARKLSVDDGGKPLGTWTVAVGASGTPTPAGRTFLLALLAPPHPTYSPLILPLGFHSNVFSTFGGGPGTVGLHGWPDSSVFGQAISNGCVRVPAEALRVLSGIPLGSLVLITQ